MRIECEFPSHYAHLENQFNHIDRLFSTDTTTIHKARNELKIIAFGEISTVVKSFKIPHLLNRLMYTFFRSSKAHKSYYNALRLQKLGISTPQPIALIEYFSSGLLEKSFFIAEYFEYDFTIRTPLLDNIDHREAIFNAFAAYTYDLHQKGVWHLDYSPGNILIKQTASGYEFAIVDINRMEFRTITPIQGCENFNKLWANDAQLAIMGKEYARLSGVDESLVISKMQRHNDANKRVKNFKKRLKNLLKGDFSTPL